MSMSTGTRFCLLGFEGLKSILIFFFFIISLRFNLALIQSFEFLFELLLILQCLCFVISIFCEKFNYQGRYDSSLNWELFFNAGQVDELMK